jgi:hypothetical protein
MIMSGTPAAALAGSLTSNHSDTAHLPIHSMATGGSMGHAGSMGPMGHAGSVPVSSYGAPTAWAQAKQAPHPAPAPGKAMVLAQPAIKNNIKLPLAAAYLNAVATGSLTATSAAVEKLLRPAYTAEQVVLSTNATAATRG